MRQALGPDALRDRLPTGAVPVVMEWLRHNRVQVRISAPRRTKLGDYRSPTGRQPARITVNGDLDPYAFLVTLVHEFAHHVTFERCGPRVRPHGAEWKSTYAELMRPYLAPAVMPHDVRAALERHLTDASASSCADHDLQRVLHRYSGHRTPLLDELPEHTIFRSMGRLFVKGATRRTRVACRCLNDRRLYTMDRMAGVQLESPLRTTADPS